jgi:hypothetical protein
MSFRFRTWIALAALTVAAIIVGSAPGLGGAVVQTGVQPTEPSVASLMARLRFSDIPKDDEFLRTSVFAQPLVPVGSTSPEENKQLAALLVAYDAAVRSGHRDAAEPLLRFLADHPPSAWKPALLVNLGAVYRQTGHFSKALVTARDAQSDTPTNPRSEITRDKGDSTWAISRNRKVILK